MNDDIPTPLPVGPGATIAGMCGLILLVTGFIVSSSALWLLGILVLALAWLYAHLRDKRQREYMADEYLRHQRLLERDEGESHGP